MSNVIQFLEAAGRNAALTPADYAAVVARLDVDDAQREALLAHDHAALNQLLHGRDGTICMISTPEENEPESSPDDADDAPPPDPTESESSR